MLSQAMDGDAPGMGAMHPVTDTPATLHEWPEGVPGVCTDSLSVKVTFKPGLQHTFKFSPDRSNVMSYFGCPQSKAFSPQQIGVMRSLIETGYRQSVRQWALHPLGGKFHPGDSIAALTRKNGQVELFARGMNNRVWQNYWPHPDTPDGWSGWFQTAPGAVMTGPPGVFSLGPDHVQLAFIGTDHQAWSAYWTEATGNWALHPLGGKFHPGDSIAALTRKNGQVELFARGMNNAAWQNYWPHPDTPDGWSGWFQPAPGAVMTGPPGVFSLGPDHVQLALNSTDQAWSIWWGGQ